MIPHLLNFGSLTLDKSKFGKFVRIMLWAENIVFLKISHPWGDFLKLQKSLIITEQKVVNYIKPFKYKEYNFFSVTNINEEITLNLRELREPIYCKCMELYPLYWKGMVKYLYIWRLLWRNNPAFYISVNVVAWCICLDTIRLGGSKLTHSAWGGGSIWPPLKSRRWGQKSATW